MVILRYTKQVVQLLLSDAARDRLFSFTDVYSKTVPNNISQNVASPFLTVLTLSAHRDKKGQLAQISGSLLHLDNLLH
ncbi:hypothetical protein [Streptococcus acidominimus]|uniref:hypothetical protein n=1 Tax=Streptococcus acidominimus TaxID=1326 RepID=UPI0012FDDBDD|nr:hypothetical protein [Streptococcus acidominimus]